MPSISLKGPTCNHNINNIHTTKLAADSGRLNIYDPARMEIWVIIKLASFNRASCFYLVKKKNQAPKCSS